MILKINQVYNLSNTVLGTLPQDWALNINANWYTIDEHDHSEVLVKSTDLICTGDVDFSGFSITQLDSIQLSESVNAHTTSLWIQSGDLIWCNGLNENVKITLGNAIDTTNSTMGGFYGDYVADGIALYTSTGNVFSFDGRAHAPSTIYCDNILCSVYTLLNTSNIELINDNTDFQLEFNMSKTFLNPVFARSSSITQLMDTSGKGYTGQLYIPLLTQLGGALLDHNSDNYAQNNINSFSANSCFFPYMDIETLGNKAIIERRIRKINPMTGLTVFQAYESKTLEASFTLNNRNMVISGVKFCWKWDQYGNDNVPLWIRYLVIKTKQIILGELSPGHVRVVYTITNEWNSTLDVSNITNAFLLNGVDYTLSGLIVELTYGLGV